MIWKTLAGRCIHYGTNEIQVHQNLVYRWLTLGSDAIQTLINRRHPECSGLKYIQPLSMAARAAPGLSCLLGLGGAGVAHALAPWFGDARLDAVESNLEVIEIAEAYFMTGQIDTLNIIHQDAFLFMQHAETQYQHVMVDLFNAHAFPEHCNNADFFKHCRHALLPGGVLAVNLANLHEQWPVFMHIRDQFPQCTVCIPVKGTANMIVLACKDASVNSLLKTFKNLSFLQKLVWDARWGCIVCL